MYNRSWGWEGGARATILGMNTVGGGGGIRAAIACTTGRGDGGGGGARATILSMYTRLNRCVWWGEVQEPPFSACTPGVCVVRGGGTRLNILSMYTRLNRCHPQHVHQAQQVSSSACTPGSTGVILSMYTRLNRCHPQHVHQARGSMCGVC